MRNLGLDLEKQQKDVKDTDWTFGAASLPCITDIPQSERHLYLPSGELQFGIEDFMDCASRGPLNILEAKLNWLYLNGELHPENRQWLETKGYVHNGRIELSDRYVAIKSNTTRNGNSLVAPLDAIHRHGCIPKSLLPSNPSFDFDRYHNQKDITDEMERLGQEFSRRFVTNYEQVREEDFERSLDYDFLIVAVHAWPPPTEGIYPRTEERENHVVCVHMGVYYAFDNYLDTDADYVKHLAPNYNFYPTGYRIFITKQNTNADIEKDYSLTISLYRRLVQALQALLRALT